MYLFVFTVQIETTKFKYMIRYVFLRTRNRIGLQLNKLKNNVGKSTWFIDKVESDANKLLQCHVIYILVESL